MELSIWVDAAEQAENAEALRADGLPKLILEIPSAESGSKATGSRGADTLIPYRRPWTSLHPYPASDSPSSSQQSSHLPSPKLDESIDIQSAAEWNQSCGSEEIDRYSNENMFGADKGTKSQLIFESKSNAKSKLRIKGEGKQRNKRKIKGRGKDKGKDKNIERDDVSITQQPTTYAISSDSASSFEDAGSHISAVPEVNKEVAEGLEAANDVGSEGTVAPGGGARIYDNAQPGDDSVRVDAAEPYLNNSITWSLAVDARVESLRGVEAEACNGSDSDNGYDVAGAYASADIDTGSVSEGKGQGEQKEASEPPEEPVGKAGPSDPIGSGGNRPDTNSSSGSGSKEEEFWPRKWPEHPSGGYKAPLYDGDVQRAPEEEAMQVGEVEADLENESKSESEPEIELTSLRPPKEKSKQRSKPESKSASKDKEKSTFKSGAHHTPTKSKSKAQARLPPLDLMTAKSSRHKSSTTSIAPKTSKSRLKAKAPQILSPPASRPNTAPIAQSKSKSKGQTTSHSAKTVGKSSRRQILGPSNVAGRSTKKEPGCCECCIM